MSKSQIHTCVSAMTPDEDSVWPALPTETEIYILPTGEIVVADLPAELATKIAHLSQQQYQSKTSPESANNLDHVTNQQHSTQPAQPD